MRSFFDKLRYRFGTFMYGRYGTDGFNTCLIYTALVLAVINLLFRSGVISILEFVIMAYALFRMFSKNLIARRKENQKYYQIKQKITGSLTLVRDMIRDRKTHVFKKCPACRAILRFPRKPGNHTAICPKCRHHFDVHVK